jgi:two-component system, NtrC family, response regulator AtoC
VSNSLSDARSEKTCEQLIPHADAARGLYALVVDDDPQVLGFVTDILRADGWHVCQADTAEQSLEMLGERNWSLVFCDVVLGGASGFDVLRSFAEAQPKARIVLMTGYGSAVGALDATALGAYDYLLKPFDIREVEELSTAVRKQSEKRLQFEGENKAVPVYTSDIDLIGKSPALVKVMKMVGRLAATSLPVLITGESGTGKEVVARAIHHRSPRALKPFVAVNCGALTAELIESELFGHIRGAFTGADRDRPGLFEEADGGTVFLDEVTETTPGFQVKLLRALQEGEIRRVGSSRTMRVDVRVIAASNRDPLAEVRQGRFRQDLLYRLNAANLHLPPLRERREDILPLAEHFAEQMRAEGGARVRFSRETSYLLEKYPWPGNIRELGNAVMRAVALSDHIVRPEDLPEGIRHGESEMGAGEGSIPSHKSSILTVSEWLSLESLEGEYIARVLEHTGGNKQAAARLLKIDRKTLDRMILKHKIYLRSTHEASCHAKAHA